MNKVAISGNLENVKAELKKQGYEVVELESNQWQDAKAVVVSGGDVNMMDIQTTLTNAPIIDASGKTAQEIVADLEKMK